MSLLSMRCRYLAFLGAVFLVHLAGCSTPTPTSATSLTPATGPVGTSDHAPATHPLKPPTTEAG